MTRGTLTWMAVFNPPDGMEGWTFYRIEYEPDGPEGRIWLPPGVDPEDVEELLDGQKPPK